MDFGVKRHQWLLCCYTTTDDAKCIPALRVISMACSYRGGLHVLEISQSLYCPGLEDKRKGDWVLLYNKEDQLIKASLICFLSLGALIAYCNQSHSHSCNRHNQTGNHSCCSHHNDDDSCAVRSHSSGWMGGSSVGSLDSSYRPGLETSEVYVTAYTSNRGNVSLKMLTQKININTWLTGSALSIPAVSILFLLVDLLGLSFLDFTLKHKIIYNIKRNSKAQQPPWSVGFWAHMGLPCFHQHHGILSPLPSWQQHPP